MISLAIANQKGGVGKSTLSVHLAYAALDKGLRVLLVDMDKQGSLSLSFPVAATTPDTKFSLVASELYGGSDYIAGKQPLRLSDKLSIIRADNDLLSIDKADTQVIRVPGRALARFKGDFDLCLIDTPPLLGIRLMAALAAADCVVTPVSVGLYELAGLSDLLQTIAVIKAQGYNPLLRHIGILPMKTNSRSSDEREALAVLRANYGDIIFPVGLPERAPVRKAIARRKPVWQSPSGAGHLKAAQEWRGACNFILNKVGV